jgi:hypothetical protein
VVLAVDDAVQPERFVVAVVLVVALGGPLWKLLHPTSPRQ